MGFLFKITAVCEVIRGAWGSAAVTATGSGNAATDGNREATHATADGNRETEKSTSEN